MSWFRNLRKSLLWFALLVPHVALGRTISVSDFIELAKKCAPNVADMTLASVAMTESGFNRLAVYDNTTGKDGTPATPMEAAALVDKLIAAEHSVDVGLMQINSKNFRRLGLNAETALDPCTSITAAGRLLSENYAGGITHAQQQASLRGALSAYNTGNTEAGLRNGYVRKVELAASRFVPALDVGNAPQPATNDVRLSPSPDLEGRTSWDVWAPTDEGKPADKGPSSSQFVF